MKNSLPPMFLNNSANRIRSNAKSPSIASIAFSALSAHVEDKDKEQVVGISPSLTMHGERQRHTVLTGGFGFWFWRD